jgi:hypothetical protein
MAAPGRHPLVATTGWLLPVAVAVALLGAATAHALTGRLVAGWFALLGIAAWIWQRRQRPVLLVDDDGWAIERHGREALRVRWAEVKEARVDRPEHAVYLDCGDPGRNLLVPPRRGFGFRFDDQQALFARVLAALPAERVREVERLDRDLGRDRGPDLDRDGKGGAGGSPVAR